MLELIVASLLVATFFSVFFVVGVAAAFAVTSFFSAANFFVAVVFGRGFSKPTKEGGVLLERLNADGILIFLLDRLLVAASSSPLLDSF